MADNKLRVFKMRNQSAEELNKSLDALKNELSQLRVAKVAGGAASKICKIKTVRKAIAKHLTVICEKSRAAVREEYKGKNKIPKQLRGKQTRSIRRRLTPAQLKKVTAKAQKKADNFPLRKFALRA